MPNYPKPSDYDEDMFAGQSPYEYQLFYQPPVERLASARAASRPERPSQSAPKPKALSKAQALSIVRTWKRGLVVASIVGFGILSGLAINHAAGATASQTSATPTPQSQFPSTSAPVPNDDGGQGGFFNQQQGGSNFGSNNSGSSPAPFTHSGVS